MEKIRKSYSFWHFKRAITFGLACILCTAIAIGLLVAIIAGIAYGYNYSMAEFITFTRSDVTVFMRRGQFNDAPDVQPQYRRMGAGDMMLTNTSTDYEDRRSMGDSKPLASSWSKTHDTRKYSDSLSKYGSARKMENFEAQQPDYVPEPPSFRALPIPIGPPTPIKLPTQVRRLSNEFNGLPTQVRGLSAQFRGLPTRTSIQALPKVITHLKPSSESPIISIVPNPLMPTVSWRSSSSNIVMRNFQPIQDYGTTTKDPGEAESLFPNRATKPPSIPLFNTKDKKKGYEVAKMKGDNEKLVSMRVWGPTTRPIISDDPEDIDEDNIVYKPV